ncbi:hypothetical protein [Leptospira ilyithenensis]|uniref:Lipoprotein n=1 Tax=Leptospira ilyithenensis TaxID=2484901 RepID=A0A4R9LRZ4_9LEPT|nr:hypothetical protein [Leptospira ilyithenensis]TGN10044.1 hypothetical protein EHS11_10810 [Leptospira ilyithenensis]
MNYIKTLVILSLIVFFAVTGCKNDKKEEVGDFSLENPITLLLLYSLISGPAACNARSDDGVAIAVPETGTYSICGNTGNAAPITFAKTGVNYSVVAESGSANYFSTRCSSTSRTLSVALTRTASGITSTIVSSGASTSATADLASDTTATYSMIGSGAPSLTCSGASVTPSLKDFRITFTAK